MGVMRKRAALALAVSLIALPGCVTQEELRKRDQAACISYGFQRGTTEFSTCLQRESISRRYGYGDRYRFAFGLGYGNYWGYGHH
jgi:hypothetical protein